jgi:hypothetical protein
MKLMSTIFFTAALAVVTLSWKYAEPIRSQNGTSVIYAMSTDKKGGKPFTVKLPDNLTTKQLQLLAFAYDIAKADGHKYPQYIQGILMQETKAGGMQLFRVAGLTNTKGDRYFGVGQIKLATAKEVMSNYPELWKFLDTKTDEELQAKLILDDEFNVRVASKYALLMGMNRDPIAATTSYNLGAGGATMVDPKTHDYTLRVKGFSQRMKNVNTSENEIQFKPKLIALR